MYVALVWAIKPFGQPQCAHPSPLQIDNSQLHNIIKIHNNVLWD